jgi:Fe-Mn family superoxide dismutase
MYVYLTRNKYHMQKSLPELKQLIIEAETRKEHLVLEKLPYGRTDLEPVMSEATLDYHYGKLAKGYVDRYNKGEGDPAFNEAGAFLHNIFFPQLKAPSNGKPFDDGAEFINKHFNNFDALKAEVEEVAMKIQGSGWVYLARNGKIKTIVNHQIRQDIVLLIDWWEHSWSLDYQADKQKYLKNIWRIIDWSVINDRISTKTS